MKTKSIIFSGLLLALVGAATTSCEDMLEVEDELHTTNLAPQDTVYQMFGIINRIQSLVDRTVVLGEFRADLMEVDPDVAKTSLQEVMDNNITTDNEYNQAADYYAVVNACNIYLAYVDSAFVSHNKLHYEREIQAARVFRAWTYLELVKVYGKVPFILDPVLSSANADDILEAFRSETNMGDMNTICSYFIDELLPYASKYIELPNYGTVNGFRSTQFFIPVRLMLAELYLWRGAFNQSQDDYINACRYYHDYFCYPNQEITTGVNRVRWNNQMLTSKSDNYSGNIENDAITIIPLDTCAYDGTWSQLYAIFNSQFENNYFIPVYPSARIREISRDQVYCYYSEVNLRRDTIYSTQKQEWEDSLEMGDLRLSGVYNRSYVSNMYTDIYSYQRQHIMKYATSTSNNGPDTKLRRLNLFRRNIVWLHFAEALNRAGFPQTAFVVLKYGLDYYTIQQYVTRSERSALNRISTFFMGGLSSWDSEIFVTEMSPRASSANVSVTMQGLHSRGSGDSRYNDFYDIPRDSALWANVDSLNAYSSALSTEREQLLRDHSEVHTEYRDTVFDVMYLVKYDADGNVMYDADGQMLLDTVYNYHQRIQRSYYVWDDDSIEALYDSLGIEWNRVQNEYERAESEAYELEAPIWQESLHQMILDEQALEGMFEGYRFWDLMRYAMYKGDRDYIANEVAKRKGAAEHDTRADKLKGGNWYLPLPTR